MFVKSGELLDCCGVMYKESFGVKDTEWQRFSLKTFAKGAGEDVSRMVDSVLDAVTDGDHSVAVAKLEGVRISGDMLLWTIQFTLTCTSPFFHIYLEWW